jgi:hypothetical protein
VASASDYYVATNGNDNNPGTFSEPFATWQKAFDIVKAGDIVYIRDGIYYFSDDSKYAGVGVWDKDGTLDNPIQIFAYPGETPILDVSNFRNYYDQGVGIYLNNCHYWHLKGLSVRGTKQYITSRIGYGVFLYTGGNITLEEVKSYDNGGIGFSAEATTGTVSFINCDSYNNYDTLLYGENADGFVCTSNIRSSRFIYQDCRSWNNSDDGYDSWSNEGTIIYDYCWSFNNGRGLDGDGNGFKLGGKEDSIALNTPQKTIIDCIAYNNRNNGFDQNASIVSMNIFNNIAFDNRLLGFCFCTNTSASIFIRNNISFGNDKSQNECIESNATHDHNSWNIGDTFTDKDFVSLDPYGIDGSRLPDGSLPDNNFLKLAPGSYLINAGTDVGLPFSGIAPDLGAFEKE